MFQAAKLPDARKGKRSLIAFSIALFLIFCVGAIFSAISHDSPRQGKDQSDNISQLTAGVNQLTAGVNKVMQETSRAGAMLSAGIEPPPLANTLASAKSRADLERYLSTLKMAEANAASAMPRYDALLTQERNEIENLSHS
jgi:X-X-X-Leu-X-X-Gly heptad repeat protein